MSNFLKIFFINPWRFLYRAVIYVLLFLIGLHFFGLTGYLLAALGVIVLIKTILSKEIRLSRSLIITIIFCSFSFVLSSVFETFSFQSFVYYFFGPLSMYVLVASASLKSRVVDFDEHYIFNLFYSFFLGLLLLVALNILYTITMAGFFQTHRILFNIWTPNETKAATYFSLQVGVLSAVSLPLLILGIKKNKWHYCLFSILALIFSFYGSFVLANRSFFVIFALSFIFFPLCCGIQKFQTILEIYLDIVFHFYSSDGYLFDITYY